MAVVTGTFLYGSFLDFTARRPLAYSGVLVTRSKRHGRQNKSHMK
jgi:hypothetical protein